MSLESKIVDALREAVPPLALGAVVAFLGATVYALARHWWEPLLSPPSRQ
jgi:hypothetical protein